MREGSGEVFQVVSPTCSKQENGSCYEEISRWPKRWQIGREWRTAVTSMLTVGLDRKVG